MYHCDEVMWGLLHVTLFEDILKYFRVSIYY